MKNPLVSVYIALQQGHGARYQGLKNISGVKVIGIAEYDAVVPLADDQTATTEGGVLVLRKPMPEDGPGITALIRRSPPLDENSAYCHLLQCTHFAETCVVAERSGVVLGWVAAYRPPSAPDQIFVWQVAVDPTMRGRGLAGRMLNALAEREATSDAVTLTATITAANAPSWALFDGFARARGAKLRRGPLFDRERHFAGAQEGEWLATVQPLHPTQ